MNRSLLLTVALSLCLSACGDDGSGSDCEGSDCDGFINNEDNRAANNEANNATSDNDDEFAVSWETFEERPCPDDNELTFSNFGRGFMLSWCTGCHSSSLRGEERAGAPDGTDFDRLAPIQDFAERIWVRSADDNLTMPPVGGPSDEERFLLGQWLACGAPE